MAAASLYKAIAFWNEEEVDVQDTGGRYSRLGREFCAPERFLSG
jgi:hypothetical protein